MNIDKITNRFSSPIPFLHESGLAILGFAAILAFPASLMAVLLLCLAVTAWGCRASLWQARLGILSLCCGSDIYIDAFALLLLVLSALSFLEPKRCWRIPYWLLPFALLLMLAVVSGLFNQGQNLNLLALPLWLTSFAASFGFYSYFVRYPLTPGSMGRICFFIAALILLEIAYAWHEAIRPLGFTPFFNYPGLGDQVTGTLRGSTDFALLLMSGATLGTGYLYRSAMLERPTGLLVLFVGGSFFFARIADAKTVILSYIIVISVVFLLNSRWRLSRPETKYRFALLLCLVVLARPVLHRVQDKYQAVYFQYVTGAYNKKRLFLQRAASADNRSPVYWLLGYGPGRCGSRAANMRAYDTLYKSENSETHKLKGIFSARTSACSRRFLLDLHTPEYAAQVHLRSALLGSAFSSWAALWFETGLFGTLIWLFFLGGVFFRARRLYPRLPKSGQALAFSVQTYAGVIVLSGFITQAFERGLLMVMFWFLLALLEATVRRCYCLQALPSTLERP